MKKELNASVVQFEPESFGSKHKNLQFHIKKIEELSVNNDLIVFPELSLTNFFESGENARLDYWKASDVLEGEFIQEIINYVKTKGIYVVLGFSEKSNIKGYMHNTALLIYPDGSYKSYHKVHLPGPEKSFFVPGENIEVFDTDLGRIGLSICYDMFFPEVSRTLALKGAEIVINISSVWKNGGAGGHENLLQSKAKQFNLIPVVQAMCNQVYFISANGCGKWYGGEKYGVWERMGYSKIVDPFGTIIAQANSEPGVIQAKLTEEKLLFHRSGWNFFMDRSPSAYKIIANNS